MYFNVDRSTLSHDSLGFTVKYQIVLELKSFERNMRKRIHSQSVKRIDVEILLNQSWDQADIGYYKFYLYFHLANTFFFEFSSLPKMLV